MIEPSATLSEGRNPAMAFRKNVNGLTPGPVWSFTVGTVPDLEVTSVQTAGDAFSGQEIEVTWTVVPHFTGISVLPQPHGPGIPGGRITVSSN